MSTNEDVSTDINIVFNSKPLYLGTMAPTLQDVIDKHFTIDQVFGYVAIVDGEEHKQSTWDTVRVQDGQRVSVVKLKDLRRRSLSISLYITLLIALIMYIGWYVGGIAFPDIFHPRTSAYLPVEETEYTEEPVVEVAEEPLEVVEEAAVEAQPDSRIQAAPNVPEAVDFSDMVCNRRLNKEELKKYSLDELRLMRNTIYARHGRKFASKQLTQYFSQFSWYKPKYDKVPTSELSATEHFNLALLSSAEFSK